MNIKDLIKLYDKKKERYGIEAYRYISNLLAEAKTQHEKDFNGTDHEQSWRAFKGKNLEKLIEYIITGIWHNRARQFNFYLRGFKYLFIMKKNKEE
ncbi:MAG: hypothetical protein V1872_04575 [bacterium]